MFEIIDKNCKDIFLQVKKCVHFYNKTELVLSSRHVRSSAGNVSGYLKPYYFTNWKEKIEI